MGAGNAQTHVHRAQMKHHTRFNSSLRYRYLHQTPPRTLPGRIAPSPFAETTRDWRCVHIRRRSPDLTNSLVQ